MSFFMQELETWYKNFKYINARTIHIMRLLHFLFEFMPYATKVLVAGEAGDMLDLRSSWMKQVPIVLP